MDTKHEEMTAAEHVERAQSQGQTVADYCRQTGLSVHALYSARRQLRAKGLLPGGRRRRSGSPEAREVHPGESDGGGMGGGVPGAPSGGLGDRVCELAGSELDEGADGRASMMRPCAEDLKIYLHRAPIDMRKGRNALAALAQEVMRSLDHD